MNTLSRTRLPLKAQAIPPEGMVDLWLIALQQLPLDSVPAGHDRADRLRGQRIRQRFMLRLLLGSYLGCPGRDLELVRGERGKPMLGERHADSALAFNVSHSGQWLAVAVSHDCPLGVDIELERSMPRAAALARRYFPGGEAEGLSGLDEPFRSRTFLQHWTAREALVKARGCGLAGTMDRIALAGSPPGVAGLPADWPQPDCWSLIMPPLPEGLVGHVAVGRPGVAVDVRVLETGLAE
jgi:4'-phosphopantetheinyl transferase